MRSKYNAPHPGCEPNFVKSQVGFIPTGLCVSHGGERLQSQPLYSISLRGGILALSRGFFPYIARRQARLGLLVLARETILGSLSPYIYISKQTLHIHIHIKTNPGGAGSRGYSHTYIYIYIYSFTNNVNLALKYWNKGTYNYMPIDRGNGECYIGICAASQIA